MQVPPNQTVESMLQNMTGHGVQTPQAPVPLPQAPASAQQMNMPPNPFNSPEAFQPPIPVVQTTGESVAEPKPRRRRRTKEEIAADNAEKERKKAEKAAAKAAKEAAKGAENPEAIVPASTAAPAVVQTPAQPGLSVDQLQSVISQAVAAAVPVNFDPEVSVRVRTGGKMFELRINDVNKEYAVQLAQFVKDNL